MCVFFLEDQRVGFGLRFISHGTICLFFLGTFDVLFWGEKTYTFPTINKNRFLMGGALDFEPVV